MLVQHNPLSFLNYINILALLGNITNPEQVICDKPQAYQDTIYTACLSRRRESDMQFDSTEIGVAASADFAELWVSE